MIDSLTREWDERNRWQERTFIAAGGLFLASPVAKGLVLVTGETPPEPVVALFAFAGLVAALGGLLGFYPRIAAQVPHHAVVGALTTGLALTLTVGVSVWIIGGPTVGAASDVNTLASPPEFVFQSMVVLLAVAFVLMGSASLRVAEPSRSVGALVLLLAVPWLVVVSASALSESALPVWLLIATYGSVPVGLIVTGYAIRYETQPLERETAVSDLEAG